MDFNITPDAHYYLSYELCKAFLSYRDRSHRMFYINYHEWVRARKDDLMDLHHREWAIANADEVHMVDVKMRHPEQFPGELEYAMMFYRDFRKGYKMIRYVHFVDTPHHIEDLYRRDPEYKVVENRRILEQKQW